MVEQTSIFGSLTPDGLIELATRFCELAEKIKETVNKQDHHHTINHTSSIIDQLLPQEQLILYDLRAHAYAMQGQPNAAIEDAQQMITLSPTLAAGYLRKANVYSMYGNQTQAIAAYDEGLQHASTDIDCYIEQMTTERTAALNVRDQKRMDFIASLPAEVVDDIIARLPQDAKAASLVVSTLWRTKVLGCAAAWENLSISDDNDEKQFLGIVPDHIGHLVRHLVINTAAENVTPVCFRAMKKGYFNRIESFKMTAVAAISLSPYAGRLLIALNQTSKTLITLDLDLCLEETGFGRVPSSPSIILADIISACSNLKNLKYSTYSSLAKVGGNFSTLEQHNTLINMQLKAPSITRQHIEFMLQRCQKLRRFVIDGCDDTVLDAINRHLTNLEIFAYNPSFTIPQLHDDIIMEGKGLRQIYANNYGGDVSATSLLPFLYKNRTTLEIVHALMSPISNQAGLQNVYASYPSFRLERVTKLTIKGNPGIQELMLQSIRNITTLTDLTVTHLDDARGLVDAIVGIPPLTIIDISHMSNNVTTSSSLVTLFTKYANISGSGPSLQCASFQYCNNITDTELAALAGIKMLHAITLYSLCSVSGTGIRTLTQALSDQLKTILLGGMNAVNDSVVIALGDLKKVTSIELVGLQCVTNKGIQGMVDRICCTTTTLNKLVVTRCNQITKECITYTNQKIKVVVHHSSY